MSPDHESTPEPDRSAVDADMALARAVVDGAADAMQRLMDAYGDDLRRAAKRRWSSSALLRQHFEPDGLVNEFLLRMFESKTADAGQDPKSADADQAADVPTLIQRLLEPAVDGTRAVLPRLLLAFGRKVLDFIREVKRDEARNLGDPDSAGAGPEATPAAGNLVDLARARQSQLERLADSLPKRMTPYAHVLMLCDRMEMVLKHLRQVARDVARDRAAHAGSGGSDVTDEDRADAADIVKDRLDALEELLPWHQVDRDRLLMDGPLPGGGDATLQRVWELIRDNILGGQVDDDPDRAQAPLVESVLGITGDRWYHWTHRARTRFEDMEPERDPATDDPPTGEGEGEP